MEVITQNLYVTHEKEFQLRHLAKGEIIFREQEEEQFFFFLQKGTARLTKMGESGKEITLDYRKKGQYLDGNSIYSSREATHFVTAIMVEDGVIGCIPIYRLREILKENAELSYRLMGCQICVMKKYVTSLSNLLIYEKERMLLYTLYKTAVEHGMKTEEGIRITLPLTQKDFALLVGVTREFVNRTFSHLEEEGILQRRKRRELFIRDLSRLKHLFCHM